MIRCLLVVLALAVPAQAYEFEEEAIRGHMKFLASDLLEGRGAGSRGYDVAAAYVATQFEAAGLEPGADGSYYQVVPFRKTVADERSTITLTPDKGSPLLLKFADAFMTTGDPLHADRTIDGRVAVVGYGVTAPELDHDDYADIDVRGKIVVLFSGAPSRFPNTLRAHYSSSSGKIENAAAHGAVGAITISSRSPWKRTVRQARLGAMHWLDDAGQPHGVPPLLSSTIMFNPATADLLFGKDHSLGDVNASLKKGTFRSFDLPVRLTIQTISSHRRVESPNVVGLVRGSDEALRDEYLVYSSHLDHLGITDPVDGDAINNGAFDNASGIAALIEVARAMASASPRRSVIFLATTAEERGLRGADYFAHNPTVPRDQLVANINIDQIMMIDAVRDVIVHGAEASTLGDAARDVSKSTGIEISEDPFPEEVVFVRSDQYPFVKQGIPALYIDPGYKSVDPSIDAKKNQQQWLKTRYHTPQDDLDQKLVYEMPAMLARYDFLVGLAVANAAARPSWKPGNFFGEKFGKP